MASGQKRVRKAAKKMQNDTKMMVKGSDSGMGVSPSLSAKSPKPVFSQRFRGFSSYWRVNFGSDVYLDLK